MSELDAHHPDMPSDGPAEAPEAPEPGSVGTMLMVDDEPRLLRVLQRYFERRGFRVLTAENAAQALAQLDREAIDLLITDLVMPRTTGLALTELARQVRPDLPIIYITGYSPELDTGPPIKLDGPVLCKPFTPEDLLVLARRVLDERRSAVDGAGDGA